MSTYYLITINKLLNNNDLLLNKWLLFNNKYLWLMLLLLCVYVACAGIVCSSE